MSQAPFGQPGSAYSSQKSRAPDSWTQTWSANPSKNRNPPSNGLGPTSTFQVETNPFMLTSSGPSVQKINLATSGNMPFNNESSFTPSNPQF